MHDELKTVALGTKYAVDAFVFVQRGLDFTVRRTHGERPRTAPRSEPPSRHVSGQQLCLGLRDFAVEQYGLLARAVLRSWGVTRCDDFGRIVFAMVEAGLMQKTQDDDLTDFEGVYDFAEAFAPKLQLSEIV